ncbi:MAG: sugar ABC transporter substrate-binding protein [Lachnospiraceae bacterium]|nr:sugar ABC transporter substrate-binding protein [Lachnospiraceae bacterium]
MSKKIASVLLAGAVTMASVMVAQAEEKIIAIVPWDMSQAFAAQFAEVATEAIEANGWKAVTMDPKGDWASEFTIIENLITQQVDGIIYTAIDADGANDAVELCKDAGIPIVGYDCLASEGGEDAAVRYDDYKGGEMAAEQVMEALQGKADAQIVVYEEEPSIASSGLRVNGFVEYMEANYPDVEVVVNRSADRTADGCYIWATDMITTYPDADAFFCWWNECTMATYNALQDAEKTGVYVIGYDAMEEQQNVMKSVGEECKLYASPGMSAAKMANKCVEYMGAIFEGNYTREGADDICQMTPELLTVHNAPEFDIDK